MTTIDKSPSGEEPGSPDGRGGSPLEVFRCFLSLGLTSFGGPIAHIGYFRQAFVVRRGWFTEQAFADLVALCQFLPGPASSQTGFAIGLMRAGPLGALAAWAGFTLPSAIVMTAFSFAARSMSGPWAQGLIHGLKLVAVAVVGQAVIGMARTLTPDIPRLLIAAAAIAMVSFGSPAVGQVAAMVLGAVAGMAVSRGAAPSAGAPAIRIAPRHGVLALVVFGLLLVGGPLAAAITGNGVIERFDAFYRSGALVFGGGHVVLPLLQQAVVDPGWVSSDTFLAGYGAAQALPGPLFTFAAYLGAVMQGRPHGVLGAAFSLIAIFLPGILLLIGVLPFWDRIRSAPGAQAAMGGANASVVGILAAALYNPVLTGAVVDLPDLALAFAGLAALVVFRAPPLLIVALGIAYGLLRVALSLFGAP